MRTRFADSVTTIEPTEWNALSGTDCPFLRHEFLATLEATGCVGPDSGWHPFHAVLHDPDGRLAGAMPLYRKTNSWGEFVFDFAWADAYRRSGLRYYPKLVSAVPFTPVTGARALVANGCDRGEVTRRLLDDVRAQAVASDLSSLHILFPPPTETEAYRKAGLLIRKDCQFHWHNRGYRTFDDFLAQLTSAKRKKLRRERRRIAEAGIGFRIATGGDLGARDWEVLMPLYASSFRRRGREPYLSRDFFAQIARALPDHLLVIIAEYRREAIATAICFRNETTLYGRYWGSSGRYHSLHFETCYYQGIEYCITHGLTCFEPGTQGEHKIARGFVPTETWSAHWLSHPQFSAAIDDYLDRERAYIDDYIDTVRGHAPYRRHPG